MALQKQVLTIPVAGLRTDIDPKGAPIGAFDLLENTQTIRTTEGGFDVQKRPGTPSLSQNIEGGGTLSAGAKLHEFGDELVATDGGLVYSWAPNLLKWVKRGRCPSVAARISLIDGTASQYVPYVDHAAFGNYLITVIDSGITAALGLIRYAVRDLTTNSVVLSGSFAGVAPRLAVVGTAVFIFFHEQSLPGQINFNLGCRTISASTPTTLGAKVTVATNLEPDSSAGRWFDVIADVTNARMVVGYRNTTPALTLKIWTTGMAAGTTVAYATEDPNSCIGFLKHDFADGNGYVVVGTSANGVRCLTFGASSMTVTVNTAVDAATTTAQAATGAVVSGVRKVIFEVPGTGTTANTNTRTKGWDGTTLFEAGRSEGLSSRMWVVGSKLYWLANHHGPLERSLFLKEWSGTGAATGDSGINTAGFLLAGDSGGHTAGTGGGDGLGNVIPGVAGLSSTHFQIACSRVLDPGLATNTKFVAALVDLTFDETQLGAPVSYNGLLHMPGAAGKVYDGSAVYEEGFYTSPEAPTLTAAAGGSLTLGARKVLVKWVRVGRSGRLERSVAGAIATVTLAGGNQTVTTVVPTYRITDSDSRYNINQELAAVLGGTRSLVNIEVYLADFGTDNYRLHSTRANDVTADTVTVSLTAEVPTGELLSAESQNATPPAVLAFAVHRNRLSALSGADNAVWMSKEAAEGLWSGFPIINRVLDTADGLPVTLVSDGTTLYIAKRSKVFYLQGDGPLADGSNPYPYPQPLPGSDGFVGPRAFVGTKDGILVQTAKGFQMLDRGGGIQPILGADTYDGLTVTGGVTLDDRPMALLTTDSGRTLCWDWQNKVWHTWTGQSAVACCLWRKLFCWLGSDGKVHVETPGLFVDDAGAYTYKLRTAWIHLANMFGRAKVYGVRVMAEFLATTTLTITTNIESYGAQVDEVTAFAGTTATKFPVAVRPAQSRAEAIRITVEETSTGQGVAVTALGLEVGIKPGAGKEPPGQFSS